MEKFRYLQSHCIFASNISGPSVRDYGTIPYTILLVQSQYMHALIKNQKALTNINKKIAVFMSKSVFLALYTIISIHNILLSTQAYSPY